MKNTQWKIWDKDDSVEIRTYKRVTGELPEMECTKQLVELISEIYTTGMNVLDVGCAAGHYYNGIKRIDKNIKYTGIDATVPYIEFAKNHFKDNSNTNFLLGDIYNLPKEQISYFDIVFCCNVILHLPSFKIPLENLLRSSNKYCIIRTLVADKTHLSMDLVTDEFDENGDPTNFAYQNTYSYSYIESCIKSFGDYVVEFIDDKFDSLKINEEFLNYKEIQGLGVTYVQNDMQISGSKVFEWKWVKIIKK